MSPPLEVWRVTHLWFYRDPELDAVRTNARIWQFDSEVSAKNFFLERMNSRKGFRSIVRLEKSNFWRNEDGGRYDRWIEQREEYRESDVA